MFSILYIGWSLQYLFKIVSNFYFNLITFLNFLGMKEDQILVKEMI